MIYRWLVGIVLLLMLPNKGKDSDARIASASMLACTLDFRDRVGLQLVRKETITAKFENKCPNVVAAVVDGERGDIVITGTQHQLKLTLSPIIENDKVHWSCRGEPVAAVTKLCKP